MISQNIRLVCWVAMCAALALSVVACSESSDDGEVSVDSNGTTSSNSTSGGMFECRDCGASQRTIVDSSTPCGYRCAPMVNTTGGGAESDNPDDEENNCVVECPEFFEIVVSPQLACGFYCKPIADAEDVGFVEEDTASEPDAEMDTGEADADEADADEVDADEADAEGMEDADESDVEEVDADETDADEVDAMDNDVAEEDVAEADVDEADAASDAE